MGIRPKRTNVETPLTNRGKRGINEWSAHMDPAFPKNGQRSCKSVGRLRIRDTQRRTPRTASQSVGAVLF